MSGALRGGVTAITLGVGGPTGKTWKCFEISSLEEKKEKRLGLGFGLRRRLKD